MILEMGCLYVNFDGEIVEIIGRETLLESIYYDHLGMAYYDNGEALNGQEKFRIVSAVH